MHTKIPLNGFGRLGKAQTWPYLQEGQRRMLTRSMKGKAETGEFGYYLKCVVKKQ